MALHQLAFATGGVGHVVPLGVLVGALALAGTVARLPRWLTALGLVSAGLSIASLATLITLGPVVFLIPLGRFTAFVFLITVAFWLTGTANERATERKTERTG